MSLTNQGDKSKTVQLGSIFHLTQVVSDLDKASRWYQEVFGADLLGQDFDEKAQRNACFLLVADMMIEVMTPADTPSASTKNVDKFFKRFGEHVYGLAWYVDKISDAFDALDDRGLRQYGVDGDLLTDIGSRHEIFTHPRETPGLLEFAEPGDLRDPRRSPGWSSRTNVHPLGIEETSRFTFVVEDLGFVTALFTAVLGGEVVDENYGSTSSSVLIEFPESPAVELVQPRARLTKEWESLNRYGPGLFQAVFRVTNIRIASDYLKGIGCAVEDIAPHHLSIGPETAFGFRIGMTDVSPVQRQGL
jgi:catechol 2,3-dioxygenase-like lactoylglutathione lyase family enzyme